MAASATTTFCDVCKTMLREISDSSRWTACDPEAFADDDSESVAAKPIFSISGRHHMSTSCLLVAAAQGCAICARLRSGFNDDGKIPYSQAGHNHSWLGWNFEIGFSDVGRFVVAIFTSTDGLTLGNFDGQPLPSRPSVNPHQLCNSTKDEDVLALAKLWLSNCELNHQWCVRKADTPYQPPRILQLRENTVSLIEKASMTSPCRYATLSYCWRRHPQHMTLTANNIAMFRKGCDISRLAQTFQDAIYVAKCLGIHYLWIDSLCMLQSGEGHYEDWQKHLTGMAEIYSHCVVNFAFDHGEDAHASCFRRRSAIDIQPCVIDFASLSGNAMDAGQSKKVPQLSQIYQLEKFLIEHDLSENTRLRTRGWVYQERVLSPRILHFGRDQIAWECSRLTACETYPQGFYSHLGMRHSPFSIYADDASLWDRIVEGYSTSRLTHPGDKLPAIAGIAKQICARRRTTYAAGLLICDLNLSTSIPSTFLELGIPRRISLL